MAVPIVYMDDILITGNDEEEIKNLYEEVARQFDIMPLGTLKYFLRIEVVYSKVGIFIHYINIYWTC